MVYTQHYRAKCASEQIRRNGHSGGRAKYQCKAYGHQGYFQPAAVEIARQYAQVDQLLLERNSLRSIARATGVARNTAKRVKKKRSGQPHCYPDCGRKKRNASAGKPWNWMKCGRLWVARSAKCGSGWPLSAPAGASWLGCWAAGAPQRLRGSGRRCPAATTATRTTLPMPGVPTRRYCQPLLTASARPVRAWSRPLTASCGTAEACSCAAPVHSASAGPATTTALKSPSTSIIWKSP